MLTFSLPNVNDVTTHILFNICKIYVLFAATQACQHPTVDKPTRREHVVHRIFFICINFIQNFNTALNSA